MSAETSRALRAEPRALDALAEYRAARQRGQWQRLSLPGADLRDTDMSGLDLDECDLTHSVLDGARFLGASLVRSQLVGASLVGADFAYANLDRADLEGAGATASSFSSATLKRANLGLCQLTRANLSNADLSRASFYKADLTAANLTGAFASQADLRGAVLEDAVLTAVRGEPVFSRLPDLPSVMPIAWPAARLGEAQLAELAGSYLSTQGWVIEPSSWADEGIDLMAQRDNSTIAVEVKATATPSSHTITHLAQRMKHAVEGRPNAHLVLVMPGPIPDSIRDLARANQISVLIVWVDKNAMRVEEAVSLGSSELQVSA